MPNRLTGVFDIAFEFSQHTLNRFLAAVHQNDNRGPMTFLHRFKTRIADEAEGVHGEVEVQVGPPHVELLAAERVRVLYPLMAHWMADGGRANPGRELPEFIHGDLQVTAGVHQQETERMGSVLVFNLGSSDIEVIFLPATGTDLRADQHDRINRVLHGFLCRAFQAENMRFDSPSNVYYLTFKIMPGEKPGITLLLNLRDVRPPAGASSGANQVFLRERNDLALAISGDYLRPILLERIRIALRSQLPAQITVHDHDVNVELREGQLVLTISGQVRDRVPFLFTSIPVTVDFSISQALQLSIQDNRIRIREPLPAPEFRISGNVLVSLFSGMLQDRVRSELTARQGALVASANGLLAERMGALDPNAFFTLFGVRPTSTTLTSVALHPEGIVLQGTVTMPPWRPPVVDQLRPIDTGSGQIQLNAFPSWIPGGTVQRYLWDGTDIEPHRFITRIDRNRYTGSDQVCLTIFGKRISHSTPDGEESLHAHTTTHCMALKTGGLFLRIPDIQERRWIVLGGCWPPDQGNSIRGYIDAARLGPEVSRGINTVLHFIDRTSLGSLEQLRTALKSSAGKAAVSLLAIIPEGHLEKMEPFNLDLQNAAFAWSEDNEGGWHKTFNVKETPSTYVINPAGKVVWQGSGEKDTETLKAALREHLVPGGTISLEMVQLSVNVGEEAPDFLFEYAPGQEIALRKLKGRPVILLFWQTWSRPCLEELRFYEALQEKSGNDGLIVLAINDDPNTARAQQIFKDNGLRMMLVHDTSHRISRVYQTAVWPTTVFIDPEGVVTGIQMGISAKQY